MATFEIIRFEVRDGTEPAVEVAMHAFASYVHRELPGSWWTGYRETARSTTFVALLRTADAAAAARHHAAPGTHAFDAALAPLLVGPVTTTPYALVTSSDLGPRPRAGRAAGRRR